MKRHARCWSRRYNSCSKNVTYKLRFCLFVFTQSLFFSIAYILKDGRKLQDKLEVAHSNEKAKRHVAEAEARATSKERDAAFAVEQV